MRPSASVRRPLITGESSVRPSPVCDLEHGEGQWCAHVWLVGGRLFGGLLGRRFLRCGGWLPHTIFAVNSGTITAHRASKLAEATGVLADDHGAELAGYGPITTGTVIHVDRNRHRLGNRAITEVPTKVRIGHRNRDRASEPADTAIANRSRPGASLDDLMRVRDRHCRMPGCHCPAHSGDIDHGSPSLMAEAPSKKISSVYAETTTASKTMRDGSTTCPSTDP